MSATDGWDRDLGDIRDARLLYAKGGLFVVLGTMAAVLLIIEHPSIKVAGLLGIAIWSFARAYYFAFYVVQHYADPSFRFRGLVDFGRYLWNRSART